MKIAIIGAGNIGGGLGKAWARVGHEIVFGARDPADEDLRRMVSALGPRVRVATVGEAATAGEVVVLAVPHGALEGVLAETGPLGGKVVIDCTNAIGPGLTPKFPATTSAAEQTAALLPQARIVKSFNAQGAENLADTRYGDAVATNFYCGDDAEAKAVVEQLVRDIGFDAVDAGPLKNARHLEAMTLAWISLSGTLGTRQLAFKLLRR